MRSLFSSALVRPASELSYPCWLMWVLTPGLFVGPYPFGPALRSALFPCAITPTVKAANPAATEAATFASTDTFIAYPLSHGFAYAFNFDNRSDSRVVPVAASPRMTNDSEFHLVRDVKTT